MKEAEPVPMMPVAGPDWYHGSPLKLSVLSPGSSVTQVEALARAFSHKPGRLSVEITEDGGGTRRICIVHNGEMRGYLYRINVIDPARDLVRNPDYRGSPGEEMLTKRELPVEFVCEVPLREKYEYTLED
jgi:hypothetical protein